MAGKRCLVTPLPAPPFLVGRPVKEAILAETGCISKTSTWGASLAEKGNCLVILVPRVGAPMYPKPQNARGGGG